MFSVVGPGLPLAGCQPEVGGIVQELRSQSLPIDEDIQQPKSREKI